MPPRGNARAGVKSYCAVHNKGRSHGQPVPYVSTCPACRERRAHLPEPERDQPGTSDWYDRMKSLGALAHVQQRRRAP